MENILAVLLKANGLGLSGLIVNPIFIIGAIVVIALVIAIIGLLVLRGGGKSKKGANAAALGGTPDWQRQGQQGAPGAWNQQAQPADNPWGQNQPGAWGMQNAPQQQAGAWGSPGPASPQQAGWGMQNAPQQQAGAWGSPGPASPQQAGWGMQNAPQQQAGAWGSQGGPSANAMGKGNQPAWDAPASQDPWAQAQAGSQSQQQGTPAWGPQGNTPNPSQQGPTSYGSGSSSGPSWGQPPQSADPWGTPPAQQPQSAQPGAWAQPQAFQQPSPVPFPAGSNPSAPWQQQSPSGPGNFSSPAMAQQDPATLFGSSDGDRTIVRNTGPQGRLGLVRVEEGKEPGRIYEVRKDSLSIGRSRESDIFLEDLAVSRLHASIVNMGNGNYGLKDEGSANGTKVNGQLVAKYQTYPLQEGDKIQLGQTVLVFNKR